MITNVYEMANLIHKFAQTDGCMGCEFKHNCNKDCLETICNLLLDEDKCKEMFKNKEEEDITISYLLQEEDITKQISYLLQEAIIHTKEKTQEFCWINHMFPYKRQDTFVIANCQIVNRYASKILNDFLFTKIVDKYNIIIDKNILTVECEWIEEINQLIIDLHNRKNFLDYIDNLMAKEKLDFEGFNVIKNKYKKYKNISITINEN